ncbi:MAG: TRAP transporter small permease subunit [Rhodospirillales bacterium]|nr:TRAP transporter small permease subunit [Rhodospirillales bacterium]
MANFSRIFEKLLETITMVLMIALALTVVVGVGFRWAHNSLEWYDEVASTLLAWLTYYGASLGALKRAHIGVPGVVAAMPPKYRFPAMMFAEACVFAFFIGLAWFGYVVMEALEGETLVTLEVVSLQLTQSVIPIGAVLYIIAEAMNLPQIWREATGQAEVSVKHS